MLAQLANTFWEPRLSSRPASSLAAQFKHHWWLVSLCLLFLAVSDLLQMKADGPILFMPFYLAPCLLLTWFADRRLGVLSATVAACLGPLTMFVNLPEYGDAVITLWNGLMRLFLFQTAVFLVAKLRHQKSSAVHSTAIPSGWVNHSNAWTVVVTCVLWLGAIFWLDHITPPEMSFLPLYLLPCMIFTLTFDVRWGIVSSLLAIALLSINEAATNPRLDFQLAFHWNFCVRFLVGLVILQSLNRLKHKSVLYFPWRQYCQSQPESFGRH